MKKIIKFLAVISLIILSACREDFLETGPTDEVSENIVFTSIDNARAAINGIHRFMYDRRGNNVDAQDEGGHSKVGISIDVMGEDLVHPSTQRQWFTFDMGWEAHTVLTSSLVDYTWDFYYTIMNNANIIIENIDNVDGPQDEINEIKAQALSYRAFCLFNLVRQFGLRYVAGGANNDEQGGIPIYLQSTTIPNPRSTVDSVYLQINQDLDDAIDLFEIANPREFKSHIDLNVAHGLKARVALTQEDWPTAIASAQAARSGYPLMSNADYQSGFNDVSNGEWIWGADVNAEQQNGFAGFHAYMSYNFNSSNIRNNPKVINEMLYNSFPSTDVRITLFDEDGLDSDQLPREDALTFPYHAIKFESIGSSPNSEGDEPWMRAAEMYLIEAEARQRNGDDPGAAQVLFELNSNRDPSYTLSANTGQDLLDEIWLYRRLELWGEGFRWYDLKRNNLPLDRTGANHNATAVLNTFEVPAGDLRWQWQIPQVEINNNPLIMQNDI